MKFTVYSKSTGEVLFSGEGQNPEVFENDERAVALGVACPAGWVDAVGQHHPLPEQPSPDHVWSWETKEWTDPRTLAQFRAIKLHAIEQERDRRIGAPVAYQGRMVDADARAQSNITNKINEILAREQVGDPMPAAMMIWRDADNLNVTFADQGEMKAWLQGLVIAITQRGTEAYAWSWQMKAAVEQVSSRDELDAITW